MMKNFCLALLSLLLASNSYSQTACTDVFQVDSNKQYSRSNLGEFVEFEVRPMLSRVNKSFNINIRRKCDASPEKVLKIGMVTATLYILSLDDKPLAEDVVKYTNDPLVIGGTNFDKAIDSAFNFQSLDLVSQQSVLKMFAFVFAEAARFEPVRTATMNVINSDKCSLQWSEYAKMLRSWKLISIFANSKAIFDGTPYIGGFRAFLIAPVTEKQIERYNSAITQGWQIDDGEFAPGDIKNPATELANTGKPTCAN
jgi:hypothetical protein